MRHAPVLVAVLVGLGVVALGPCPEPAPERGAIARAIRFLHATQTPEDVTDDPKGRDWAGNWPQHLKRLDMGIRAPMREVSPFLATFVHHALVRVRPETAGRLGLGPRDVERARAVRQRAVSLMRRFAVAELAVGNAEPCGFWPRATHTLTRAERLLSRVIVRDLGGPAMDGILAPLNVSAYPPSLRLWPDADDTALVHVALLAEDPALRVPLGQLFSRHRAKGGAFLTWLVPEDGPDTPNETDPCVNANVLFALARAGELDTHGVEEALALLELGQGMSGYYPEEGHVFAYLVSRACHDGPVPRLRSLTERLADEVAAADATNAPLQATFAALVLLNAGRRGPVVDAHLATLRATQASDGGWSESVMWRGTTARGRRYVWVSRAFTTALALEALVRASLLDEPGV